MTDLFAPPDETVDFASEDGTELYGEFIRAGKPVGTALIVHGYAEHCGRYREVSRVLASIGFNTLAFDLRGHGKSAGARGYVHSFPQYLKDVAAADRELTKFQPENGKRLLVGHSNGGLITLRLLSDRSNGLTFNGAVISSPFLGLKLEVPLAKRFVGRLASRLAPKLSLPNALRPELLTSCPERQAARERDLLCHSVANVRWFTEVERTWKFVAKNADRITTPTLWLVAGNDQIADPNATRAIQKRVAARCDFHVFDDMQHEVFNEKGRDKVFSLLREFCRSALL